MNELINLGNGQMVKVTMLKGERGSNIATITKTGTSGLTDTYTITLTDGSTSTFEVKNGSSIQSITKTSTVGAVDTYTITLTDGTTAGTFTVTNATGTIDQNFSASSTDPLMNKTLSGIIAGVENGSTASKTYNKNDLILRNDSLYEVQTTVASGGTWADGVNIVETTIGDLLSAGKSALTDIINVIPTNTFTQIGTITSVNDTLTYPNTTKRLKFEFTGLAGTDESSNYFLNVDDIPQIYENQTSVNTTTKMSLISNGASTFRGILIQIDSSNRLITILSQLNSSNIRLRVFAR